MATETVPRRGGVYPEQGCSSAGAALPESYGGVGRTDPRGNTQLGFAPTPPPGPRGAQAAHDTAAAAARALGCAVTEVLVCSTGPIGPRLPMDKIIPTIQLLAARAAASPAAGREAAAGLMTTDTFIKEAAVSDPGGFRVGGMAKGAAMIRPNMATMLAVITTDAIASPHRLREALGHAVDETFKSINIDGCESTNDTVILLASGASGIEPSAEDLIRGVRSVCARLARDIVADAEECTRVVTLRVSGASNNVFRPPHGNGDSRL